MHSLSILKFILTLMLAFSLGACAAKKPKEESFDSTSGNNIVNADINLGGDSDSGKAMGLQTIHFPYDAFSLSAEAKAGLKANSEIMKANTKMKIQVEGHCDARGGIQYNIALGEKRANATKAYLSDMGISAERISTVSLGKEKLLDQASTEDAHAKNRRANFVVTTN